MLSLYLQLAMAQVFTPPAAPIAEWWDVVGAPSGAVVIMSPTEALWSADGARFAPILAGDDNVTAVALDDDGTAWVARGTRIGIRTPKGAERWIDAPGETGSTRDLWVRGRFVVWAGDAGPDDDSIFMVSRDGGRTFEERLEWEVGNYALELALDAKGRVHYVTGWEAGCGGGYQQRFAGKVGDQALMSVDWAFDAPGNYFATASGWAYVGDETCNKSGLCALPPAGDARPIVRDLGVEDHNVSVTGAADDSVAWLVVADHTLVRARGADARIVNRTTPKEVRSVAVAAGRPWIATPSTLHRLDGDRWVEVKVR